MLFFLTLQSDVTPRILRGDFSMFQYILSSIIFTLYLLSFSQTFADDNTVEPSSFSLLYTNNGNGEIGPCG